MAGRAAILGAVEDWILRHEPQVRLGVFLAVFTLLAIVEALAPRRRLTTSKARRWGRNLALTLLNTLFARGIAALVPVAAVATALLAEKRGFGVLNAVDLPFWGRIVIAIVALDLAIYIQHVLFHAIPALWRLHKVHHADLDFDVTTGARFHPLEIALSMGIKSAAVFCVGAPAVAVIAFEVVLNGTAMFSHSNLRLPVSMDRILRWIVVTPDMHRVHHSVVREEHDANFGFNLPWWDRLLGTYRDQPSAGHECMAIGLAELREPSRVNLPQILILPFLAESSQPAVENERPGSLEMRWPPSPAPQRNK
jgi:sterol desaturase/sphingolipid hydroxylase (fatty acid hydroxylase superfamily)